MNVLVPREQRKGCISFPPKRPALAQQRIGGLRVATHSPVLVPRNATRPAEIPYLPCAWGEQGPRTSH